MVHLFTQPTQWKFDQTNEDLYQTLKEIVDMTNQDVIQENANVDGQSPMGQMGKIGSESAKFFVKQTILSDDVKKAVSENYLHIHDMDFYLTGTTTCCQIPLAKILKDGFNTGHGTMREPSDIHSAMALASIILQSNQNMQHGGQAYPMFDYDLAPYVRKTFQKNYRRLSKYPTSWSENELVKVAWKETDQAVYQACEAFIHNSNSMHSRGGGQVPFISINYGTDTSQEGRMLIKNMLLATQAGLGNGETPIFPIQIFKVKKGTNFAKEEPNYDLYELALETTAKRLFPNFSFIDAPYNLQYYDGTPESEVAYMGCRTRVMANLHGNENSMSRGNLSFTSINLVKIALQANNNLDHFYKQLHFYVDLTIKQLKDRYDFQVQKKAKNFPFLYSQGIWLNGEYLSQEETLEKVLKHGTLSIGFIGLAEALVALLGKHHGESKEALKIGYEIVRFMRDLVDQAAMKYQLNYSLIATPAEGLSGKFTKLDQQQFGKIKGVTDRDYYTNSFHVPVYFPIKAIEKINIEGPFHSLCNAGHISYVEVDGDLSKNILALDKIVKTMAKSGIGYGSINHPVDRCKSCGYTGIINNACPNCTNDIEDHIERIRRITGYLVGDMKKWNHAKKTEENDRVKHK